MYPRMENKYIDDSLVIVGAHQDSMEKLSHTMDMLLSLKRSGINVCFVTHCNYGLDKIAEACDYLIFDSNNTFVNDYELINCCPLFKPEGISQRWSNWYSVPNLGLFSSFMARHAPHQRSALSLIKNGINLASRNNYEWTIYLEYDYSQPLVDFGDIIKDQIEDMVSEGKDSLLLMRKNEGFISGGFSIYRTEIFQQNEMFSSRWEKDSISWFGTFRNMFFEEIIEAVACSGGEDSVLYRDEEEFFQKYWGKSGRELTLYKALTGKSPSKDFSRITAIEYLKYSLFPYKADGKYGVVLACYNISDHISFRISSSTLKISEVEIKIPDFIAEPGSWFTFHDQVIGDIDSISELNGHLHLEFDVKNLEEDYVHRICQKVPVSDIEKFWLLRRLTKE
jgi:hypothetical protein